MEKIFPASETSSAILAALAESVRSNANSAICATTANAHEGDSTSVVWTTPVEEAKRIGVTTRTLARWRASRTGPPWFRVGRGVRYIKQVTDDYLKKSRRDPLAESSK